MVAGRSEFEHIAPSARYVINCSRYRRSGAHRRAATSPAASDASSSSSPPPVHVVCTAPIVAPVPLPYHSPTFLQFDLPDDDEDLSHPPYVSRPHKRKRTDDDEDDDEDGSRSVFQLTLASPHAKRRAIMSERRGRWNTAATAAQAHPVLPQPPIPPQLPSLHPGHAICR